MIAWINRLSGRWLCWTDAHHPVKSYLDVRDGITFSAYSNAYCARCKKRMWVNWPPT